MQAPCSTRNQGNHIKIYIKWADNFSFYNTQLKMSITRLYIKAKKNVTESLSQNFSTYLMWGRSLKITWLCKTNSLLITHDDEDQNLLPTGQCLLLHMSSICTFKCRRKVTNSSNFSGELSATESTWNTKFISDS